MTKVHYIILSLLGVMATSAAAQEPLQLDTESQRYSYAVGNKIAEQMVAQFEGDPDIDLKILLEGIAVVLNGEVPLLSDQEAIQIIQSKQQQRMAEAQAAQEKKIADGEDYKAPATIDDPVILDEITDALRTIGYPSGG